MKKLLLFIILLPTILMADAVIFSGNDVKALKQNLDLFGVVKVMSGALDPSAGGGVAAPQGSAYLSTVHGLFLKTGVANTAWTKNSLLPVDLTSQVTGVLPVANGGTGSATQNFVDLTTNQTIGGTKTFSSTIQGDISGNSATVTTNANLTGDVTSIGNTTSYNNVVPVAKGGTGSATQNFVDLTTNQTVGGVKTFSSTISGSINGNAATVTTNANLTGAVTSVGNATSLGSFTSSNLSTALADETGSGAAVFATSPTLTTPNIGVATGTSLTLSGSLDAKNLMNQLNSLSDPQVERSVTLWATYADAAGTAPVDGTGNINSPTPVDVTVSNSTSSPLRQTRSLVLVKDAVNRQGQGISQDFTIDTADQGKVLQVSFDYQVASGTYADNDVSIWIYDVTNARIIQPAPYLLKNSGIVERMAVEFQSSINSTSYRLIVHIGSTSTLAYSLKFDNFSVGQQAKLYGSAVTDAVPVTYTLTNAGNATITGTLSSQGARGIYYGRIIIGSTLPTGQIAVNLPKKLKSTVGIFLEGTATTNANGGVRTGAISSLNSGASIGFFNDTGSTSGWGSGSLPTTFSAGNIIDFTFEAEIEGWSSSQIMSSDADTRVVAARYSLSSSQSIPDNSSTVIVWNSIANGGFDTHSAMNTTNGRYYAKVSGYYSFNVGFGTNSGISIASGNRSIIYYRVNSDFSRQLSWTSYSVSGTERISENGGASAYLNAGDYIEFLAVMDFGSSSYNIDSSGGGITYLSINRISGPSQIAASESVSFSANTSTTAATTSAPFIYTVKDHDSHNAYSTVTGKFTAPMSGKYSCSAGYYSASTNVIAYLYKNTSAIFYGTPSTAGSNPGAVQGVVSLLQGETVEVRPSSSATAGGGATFNYFSCIRVGN